MLVRSQDKTTLVDFSSGIWKIYGMKIWFLGLSDQNIEHDFGSFQSTKQAIEVLDLMQMANFKIEKMKLIAYITNNLTNSTFQDFTFQIPEV